MLEVKLHRTRYLLELTGMMGAGLSVNDRSGHLLPLEVVE
jgi:hypothetical protein